ncbi:velvet factor-domain-containing protein [Umbelopsis sp. PMI_123]|nr:velvet factor-domain-containing protein [Umbelopsis sp. PMI_123]
MNSGPTPPMGLARPSRSVNRYRLEVIQHPLRARCCGFGEKDRRPIDPPPVLQLFVEGEDGELITVSSLDISFFLVQCDLYSDDGTEERNIVLHPSTIPNTQFTTPTSTSSSATSPPNPGGFPAPSESGKHGGSLSTVISLRNPTPTRNLMGSLIANAVQLENPQKTTGIYFVFPDLSVRSEGKYTLKFIFFDLAVGEPLTMSTKVQAEVYTQPFTVYSAKKFPGMTESTELSKCFAKQGIKIPIRKEARFKRSTDKFYGANALYSVNASPSKEGVSKSTSIDEKPISPDVEDDIEDEDNPTTTAITLTTEKHEDNQQDSNQAAHPSSASKEDAQETPKPYKRLSISSYLATQRD